MAKAPQSIDEYIRPFPPAVSAILRKVRSTIRTAAPNAEETISYGIPAFRQDGMLVYFAAFKKHIGLFPPIRGNPALQRAASKYAGPKGNLRFPYDRKIPYGLIARITKHQARQDRAKSAARRKRT